MKLSAPFTIHVNLHEIKFSVKQISWKSQNSAKSVKFTALDKRVPYGIQCSLVQLLVSVVQVASIYTIMKSSSIQLQVWSQLVLLFVTIQALYQAGEARWGTDESK